MEELQMDWLRSEDLKEEKEVTAPTVIIALLSSLCGFHVRGQPDSRRCGKWRFGSDRKKNRPQRKACLDLADD
jgi:hypothetical protein